MFTGFNMTRWKLARIFKDFGVKRKKILKKNFNFEKYTPAVVAVLKEKCKEELIAAAFDGRIIYKVDESIFQSMDSNNVAWSNANQNIQLI